METETVHRDQDGSSKATEASAEARGFDEAHVESHLAWIFGSPRTGSSWLLRLLIHPWRLAPKTPSGIKPGDEKPSSGTQVVPINESYLPVHLTPQKVPKYKPKQAEPEPDKWLKSSKRAQDAAYFFSDLHADAWRPEVRRLILARFNSQITLARKEYGFEDPIVVVKEPNGSHGAQLMMSLLPGSRLVFLLRDGRDVIDSLMDLRLRGRLRNRGEIQTYDERLNLVLKNSRMWVNRTNAVQAAYEAHPPELRTTVRYEDLRNDTFGTLKPLAEFLGIDRTDEELRAAVEAQSFEAIPEEEKGPGKGKRAATPGLWRENVTALEREIMDEVMSEKLAELGYEV